MSNDETDDVRSDRDKHREAVDALVTAQVNQLLSDGAGRFSASQSADLANALYSVGELGLWPDHVDSMSEAQALRAWACVELARKGKWDDALNM